MESDGDGGGFAYVMEVFQMFDFGSGSALDLTGEITALPQNP